MKRFWIFAIGLLGILVICAASINVARAASANSTKHSGKVTGIDTSAKTISITNKAGEQTFTVVTATKIKDGKKNIDLAAIKINAHVTIISADGTTADKITVEPSHKKAAAKPAPAVAPAPAANTSPAPAQ
jgi:hypothetical protein